MDCEEYIHLLSSNKGKNSEYQFFCYLRFFSILAHGGDLDYNAIAVQCAVNSEG
jgi:hypothetical protein